MKIEELEKRVAALEDTEKIKTLHREYLVLISNFEIDGALDCFAENIITDIADYGIKKGKKEVSEFYHDRIARNIKTRDDGHLTGQPVISLEGDKAKGHWMFYHFVDDPHGKQWIQGRFDCEYVKEDGDWKFSYLKMKRPWPAFFKT